MSNRIVVGVDGSEGADTALRWALAEARLRNARLEVIHAWRVPHHADAPGFAFMDVAAETHKAADELLDRVVTRMVGDDPGVTVTSWTVEGPAARMLIDAAQGADLLVVGTRGRGGFTGLLLGSVSQACIHHAPCPLVVVPADA